jgi:hypothetical protein
MNMTRVTTRRSALGWSIFGFLALVSGCDSGVPQSEIDEIKDGSKGKAEAEARQKAFGTTGRPKSQKPKR